MFIAGKALGVVIEVLIALFRWPTVAATRWMGEALPGPRG
jgi:hypothetical protein